MKPADHELRGAGLFVVDAPARKIAVYPSEWGQVILMAEEDGKRVYAAIDLCEIAALVVALGQAHESAAKESAHMAADYAAFCAIEKARGAD